MLPKYNLLKHHHKKRATFAKGGSVGSLMDKSLAHGPLSMNFMRQIASMPKLRSSFNSGGPVLSLEEEIAQLEWFVGLRPSNSYEAYLIEQMKDRLFELYELKKNKK